jgi:hypothetical protein
MKPYTHPALVALAIRGPVGGARWPWLPSANCIGGRGLAANEA